MAGRGYTPVIQTTQEAQIEGLWSRHKVRPYLKNKQNETKKGWWSGSSGKVPT
jgi:hypothetical protein